MIEHLNDIHKWTREAIADWLDGLVDTDEQGEALADELFELVREVSGVTSFYILEPALPV